MAKYIKKHLIRGEEIAHQTTYHWIHFLSFRGLFSLFIIPLIQQYTDEFVVTNKRVIVKKGLIAVWSLEMNFQKIETVSVKQSILGRILGYGNLTLIGTGGTRELFKYIKDPISFRKAFMEADINGN